MLEKNKLINFNMSPFLIIYLTVVQSWIFFSCS